MDRSRMPPAGRLTERWSAKRMEVTIPDSLLRAIRPPRTLPSEALDAYQARRPEAAQGRLCHAPFRNMYFTTTGRVGCCWLLVSPLFADRWSPARSIHDIWFGDTFRRWREAITAGNLHTYCNVCEHNVVKRRGPLALIYDDRLSIGEYPSTMELELSNICALECVMCNGLLSSSIRKRRDRKKPLVSPYNDQFVEQMEEFIPHLNQIRFSGGEPFRHRLVYLLLERIERLKPDLRVLFTTSGSVMTPAIVRWVERLNCSIGLSIDSLVKERYEMIRINASFEKVMRNLDTFSRIAADHGQDLSIQMNPMRSNWDELPEFVRFCNRRRIWLSFNTVQKPKKYAIWALPKRELRRIYGILSAEQFELNSGDALHAANLAAYREVVDGQIGSWAHGGRREQLNW